MLLKKSIIKRYGVEAQAQGQLMPPAASGRV